MPSLQKCCFIFSLKTGGVILGWIGAIFSFLALVISIIVLCIGGKVVEDIEVLIVYLTLSRSAIVVCLVINFVIYIAMSPITLISASLLIAGVIKSRRYFLLPWLIFTAIILGVGFTLTMINIDWTMLYHECGELIFALFIILIIYGFGVHVWLAVLSLMQELHKERNNEVGVTALNYRAPPANDGLPAYLSLA